jgi:hypothetical protein
MVFNIELFSRGLHGIPRGAAQFGGVLGVAGVALFGLFAVVLGTRGWVAASKRGESTALGIAGTAAAFVGFVEWMIAGVDLLAVLGVIR